MVCYTNHALDQFLESCVETCQLDKGVVRVGGRSKNVSLEPFLLKNIKRNSRDKCPALRFMIREEADSLKAMQFQMSHVNKLLRILFDGSGVLNFKTLAKYMRPEHAKYFHSNVNYLKDTFNIADKQAALNVSLLDWLGLFSLDSTNIEFLDDNLAGYLYQMNLDEKYEEANCRVENSFSDERMLDEDLFRTEMILEENKITYSEFDGECITYEKIDEWRASLSGDELWKIKGKSMKAQSETKTYLGI
jgi:hypothetical protein